MRRSVAVFSVIVVLTVTGLEGRDTQLAGWFDLPVVGGASTLARFDIPIEERAFTLPTLARALEDRQSRIGRAPDRLTSIVAAMNAPAVGGVTESESINVPAPLDARTWRELLALKPADDLFPRFLTDRNAMLLVVGLMATDDSVRTLVSGDRDLLRFLYRETPGVFAVVSRRLRVVAGRLVVPGGAGADEIWERLAGSPPTRPAAFLRDLLTRDSGRLAWYFDTIAGMDDARLEAAWPKGSPSARRDQAKALYEPFRDSDPQWRVADQPFRRTFADPWSVAMLSDVADGKLTGPASETLWQLVFAENDDSRRLAQEASPPITMTRLLRLSVTGTLRERRDRFEVFRLAQRVFPTPSQSDLPDIADALSGYARFRALLLALERMEIISAPTWATTVKAARHVTVDSDDRDDAIAAFQASVGLIERTRQVRTIDAATAERLLQSLSDAVQRDRRVTRSIAAWLKTSFVPALPPLERPDAWTRATSYESTILQALAGPRERRTPSIAWEGLSYTVDVVAAEHERIRAVRSQLSSPGLEAALESAKPRELANALKTLVYASALGEPEGAVALSRDIVDRHDLGLDATTRVRDVRPWAMPEERQGFGPWRVQGALIGLDLGLSRLALRRIADEQMPAAPTLSMNDFATLTRTIVAMVPGELTDADRDELAQAVSRGRQRVAAAGGAAAALDALAREARISAVTRQLLPWVASRQPESVADVFTLRDLMWLGEPALSRRQLDRWGVAAGGLDGRRVIAMPPPAPWEDFSGRSDAGQITTQTPDLTLRLVEETARLKLPAILIPSLAAYAVNDYWHDVQARYSDDYLSVTRQAKALGATRIEDYVAALTGNGPLRAQ